MLHPGVLADMLDDEIAAARRRAGSRARLIERVGTQVVAAIGTDDAPVHIIFDGARYDAEPFRVSLASAAGTALPHEQWPAGLSHGVHPILGRPFACIQGTYEYHAHPSHLADRWDAYRHRIRLPDLLDHLLRKSQL
jgi:hypothetical protein